MEKKVNIKVTVDDDNEIAITTSSASILINREDALIGLLGGVDGINVTIPVVLLSNVDGQILTDAMAGGPVEVLIGNKQGAFPNDVGGRYQCLVLLG